MVALMEGIVIKGIVRKQGMELMTNY